MFKVDFVTTNKGKARELIELGRMYGVEVNVIYSSKVEIQDVDLKTVALHAALNAMAQLGKPIAVEDSGLFIKALNGFPGPFSSYVYKTLGINGILKLMSDVDRREAVFKSVIAYADPGVGIHVFEGEVRGTISYRARGKGGFGFDPIFIPVNSSKTFAEMNVNEKNRVSHRSKAFKLFVDWLQKSFKT